MRLLKAAATGLIALTSAGLVACQKSTPSDDKTASTQAGNVFETGKLRAVVIGDMLPMVDETTANTTDLPLSFLMPFATS